jgi:RimJ/RimL family protein N-acetyltransferase
MLTDFGFQTIGFKRIEALVDRENLSSQKLLENAGYEREGILRNKITRDDGRQVDMFIFSALPTTWAAAPT